MPFVPFAEMLADARRHRYAVGAFNVLNMETMQAVLAAQEKMGAPVILQVYHSHLGFAGADYLAAMAEAGARKSRFPVCLSLDHGESFEQAKLCIDSGFTGVMIDLASSDYGENVRTTRLVVESAHARGVSVEAELGTIHPASCPVEVRNSGMTDPEEAARFVEDTGVDALAVSIGTAHGIYSSRPRIDFPRLEAILRRVDRPIVVHGGSNTPDEDVKLMVKMGISKLNIGTDLMVAFQRGLRGAIGIDGCGDIQAVLESGRTAVEEACAEKLALLAAYRS